MNIIYRISPFKPDNPAIYYEDDKWKLVTMCHDLFLRAGGDKYDKTYILDSCPEWSGEFEKYGKVVNTNQHKKFGSLYTAMDIARGMEDKVLLVEDDYLWRPNTIQTLDGALNEFPVLSPYDHPAHYLEDRFDKHYEIKLFAGNTYRTCPSNTHTFATRAKIIADNWRILIDDKLQLARHDHPAFTELNKVAQMWCPLYSFATHLATGCTAPNVDWLSLID